MRKQHKCPYCGSINTSYYIWGFPAYNESQLKDLKKGKCILGGCIVNAKKINDKTVFLEPTWKCNKCRKDFGTEPILLNPKRQIDEFYTDIVTALKFSLHSFEAGSTFITITRDKNGADVIFEQVYPYEGEQKKRISSFEWRRVLNTLYKKLYLHEWKKSYYAPILDGESWSLEVKLTDRRRRTYYGNNAYPPYWDELKELLLGLAQGLTR